MNFIKFLLIITLASPICLQAKENSINSNKSEITTSIDKVENITSTDNIENKKGFSKNCSKLSIWKKVPSFYLGNLVGGSIFGGLATFAFVLPTSCAFVHFAGKHPAILKLRPVITTFTCIVSSIASSIGATIFTEKYLNARGMKIVSEEDLNETK